MDTGVSSKPVYPWREKRPVARFHRLVPAVVTCLFVLIAVPLYAVLTTANADPIVNRCRTQWGNNQQNYNYCVIAGRCQLRWSQNRNNFYLCVCQTWWGQNQNMVNQCVQQHRQRDYQRSQIRKKLGN